MTFEELKEEARKQGYVLAKSQRGICRCLIPREERLKDLKRNKTCLRYDFEATSRQGYTVCRRKREDE